MSDEQMRAAFEGAQGIDASARDGAGYKSERDHYAWNGYQLAAQQYQPIVDAVKAVMAMYPTDWYDVRTAKRTKEPEPIAMLRQALATLEQGGVK